MVPLVTFFLLRLQSAAALADVGGSFAAVARIFVTFLAGTLGFVFVIEGYHYLSATDDPQKAAHAKRAIGSAILGAIIVVVGVTLSGTITSALY